MLTSSSLFCILNSYVTSGVTSLLSARKKISAAPQSLASDPLSLVGSSRITLPSQEIRIVGSGNSDRSASARAVACSITRSRMLWLDFNQSALGKSSRFVGRDCSIARAVCCALRRLTISGISPTNFCPFWIRSHSSWYKFRSPLPNSSNCSREINI